MWEQIKNRTCYKFWIIFYSFSDLFYDLWDCWMFLLILFFWGKKMEIFQLFEFYAWSKMEKVQFVIRNCFVRTLKWGGQWTDYKLIQFLPWIGGSQLCLSQIHSLFRNLSADPNSPINYHYLNSVRSTFRKQRRRKPHKI